VASQGTKNPVEEASTAQVAKNIRRATQRHFSTEDKIRIVLDGLHGEDSPNSAALYGDGACEEVVIPTAILHWSRTESSPEASDQDESALARVLSL